MAPAWRREASALLVLGVATFVAGRPWALTGDRVFHHRDALFGLLAMEHLQEVLVGPRAWDAAWLGWPTQPGFTQADWMAGPALLAAPLEALGIHALDAYAAVVLLGLFATAWVCHRTAQALLGPGPHTWLAGVIGGLGPIQLSHAHHVNLVHHEWAVGGGLLLAAGLTKGRPWLAALGGLALGLAFHFGLYMGLHAGLVAAVILAVAAGTRKLQGRSTAAALGGLALGVLSFLPAAMAYARFAAAQHAQLDAGEIVAESWDLAATMRPMVGAWLHGFLLGEGAARITDPPNPGYLATLLALVGLWRVRRGGWLWVVVVAVGGLAALLALGPVPSWGGISTGLPGPYRLLDFLVAGAPLRAPARWLALSFIAVALLAAAGTLQLTRRVPPWVRGMLVCCAIAVVLGETPIADSGPRAAITPPPLYLGLQAVPEGPLYEHFQPVVDSCPCEGSMRLAAALDHGRPLVGGHWARETASQRELDTLAGRWPAAEAAELMRILAVPVVIEHPPVLGPPPDGAECQRVGDHRLCVVEPLIRGGLPKTESVETLGTGPVVGLRWLEPPTGRRLEIRCERARPWRTSTRPWRLVAMLRQGSEPAWTDVFLPVPCTTVPEVSEGSPLPLYGVGG